MGCVRRRHLVAVVMAEFAADVSNLGFKNSPTRLTKVFALTIYYVVKPSNYWFLKWNFLHSGTARKANDLLRAPQFPKC